jgi:hypothetical protein
MLLDNQRFELRVQDLGFRNLLQSGFMKEDRDYRIGHVVGV